eukprot:g50832.t1
MTQEENHDSSTFSTNEDGQISREDRQIWQQADTNEKDEVENHEDHLDGFSLNIVTSTVTGRRVRRQTPNTSTHTYRLAVAEDDDIQFASQSDTSDGFRYEDVCLFMRVLRKPEKQLRLMPQVVEARKKEIQGLYDAKCLEWATWQDADRDKVKPIRTGRKALWDDSAFPPTMAYDERRCNMRSDVEDRGFDNAKPSTTPCTDQDPQPADPGASLRQWPLRKLAGNPTLLTAW